MAGERERKCSEVLGTLQEGLQQLSSTCTELGWSLDSVLETSDSVACPLSKGHRMPPAKLEEHLSRCQLRHRGLSHADIDALPPSSFAFYAKAPAVKSLVMTPQLQGQIFARAFGARHLGLEKPVPVCPDRAVLELSLDERRVLYDSVAQTLGEAAGTGNDASELTLLRQLQLLEEQLSAREENERISDAGLESMAKMERDNHRRRRSYRGVHTDRRSQKEILREVIERQMELLRDVWSARERAEKVERKREGSGLERSRRKERMRAERSPRRSEEREEKDLEEHARTVKRRRSEKEGGDSSARKPKKKKLKEKKKKKKEKKKKKKKEKVETSSADGQSPS